MSKDNSTRQRDWRARKREAGQFMLTVWLTPENAAKLERLTSESGLKKQAAREALINELLREK